MADQEKREKVIDGLKRCLEMRVLCLNNPECPYNGCRGDGCISIMMRDALALLEMQVVHGRWTEIEDSWGDCHYQCTECGEEWNLDAGTPAENNMNYCPNCGAKMDDDANG